MLNRYDMQLKTVLYPKVMFIENALKSYVIEALLADSKSENFDVIYNKSLTAYRNHTPGSRAGEFGTLYDCACTDVKLYVSNIMKLPTNLDSDGMNTQFFIFTVKDLRNAIAHNNVVFDTRFKTGKIDQRLISLLESEVGILNIDFKYMDAYVILHMVRCDALLSKGELSYFK